VRFFKFFVIPLLFLSIIFIVAYSARVLIINKILNKVAQTQLSLVSVNVNCLDVSLTTEMSLVIDKLCVQSPKADIEITDLVIQWQRQNYNAEDSFKITNLDAKLVTVKSKEHLLSHNNTSSADDEKNQQQKSFNQLLSTNVATYAEQIQQVQHILLPMKLNITELLYYPYLTPATTPLSPNYTADRVNQSVYTVNISTGNKSLSVLVKNSKNINLIDITLNQEKTGFSIDISSKLKRLKSFVSMHQLPISKTLQNDLNNNEISGEINTLIVYQADSLKIETELKDLFINSKNGIEQSGPFSLSGDLNFNSQLSFMPTSTKENTNSTDDELNTEINVQLIEKNEIILQYSPAHLFSILEISDVSPTIISILKDNAANKLTLKTNGSARLSLSDLKPGISHLYTSNVQLSLLDISAHCDDRVQQAIFENIMFSSAPYNTSIKFSIDDFIIDSELNLNSVESIVNITTAPVELDLTGSLNQVGKVTTLILTDSSLISAKNINIKTSTEQNEKTLLSAKVLNTKLKGKVQRLEDQSLNVNLTVNNQVSQVTIPKVLKIKTFDLLSEINGSLDNINIKASPSADGVNLGNINISGSAQSPKIKISANDIPLTDLLALELQVPIAVDLIEGVLNYNISGQLADLSQFANTHFYGDIAISTLSGDIDGIWLQDLNWQQAFILQVGSIVTKANDKENLTIALMESFSPITNISVNSHWELINNNFKLSASKVMADAFGGSFLIPRIEWPLESGYSANVQLNSIDLEQVLALDKKQGIVVTGNISGQFPIMFDGDKFIVENGELYNVSNGLIQVIDNPAVAELRANNSQLQLAFDALQNLHYHQLSSAVSMADDGYMKLDTVIKGRNPDIDNDVNLNLNLTYDLLGLLESLSITQRFEDSIIKSLQKNKE